MNHTRALLTDLTDLINAAELGPVTDVRVITAPGDVDVVQVDLDISCDHKAHALLRWLDLITVWDMVAGTHHAADPVLRLNIRGEFPGGTPIIIIVAPFDRRRDRELTAHIDSHIERQQAHALITHLATLETLGGQR